MGHKVDGPAGISSLDAAAHSMLGLSALFAEMADQGIGAPALLQGTGLDPRQLSDPQARMSHAQKITVFRNVRRLSCLPDEPDLFRSIRTACLNNRGAFPNAEEMATRLGLSVRTLQRRLSEQGRHYQEIVDEVRTSLAIEFLENTSLSVAEIADRVGFSESSNFRKAFRKWTGHAPTHYRDGAAESQAQA